MRQSDSELLDSLTLTRQELAARLKDRATDPQLWLNTVSAAVTALHNAKERLGALLALEADSNRKLSDAEYGQRAVREFHIVKDGYERRIRDLLQQATDERVSASNQAAELYQRIEVEQEELRRYEQQLNDREERLGQQIHEAQQARQQVDELAAQLVNKNRAAEECYQATLRLQKAADDDRELVQRTLQAVNAELEAQKVRTYEIEESCRHYRERLQEAEDIKQQTVALRQQEADHLAKLSRAQQDYENKLYLVKKREDFVMQKWDETCRQVAHFKLPVDLQGMPTP